MSWPDFIAGAVSAWIVSALFSLLPDPRRCEITSMKRGREWHHWYATVRYSSGKERKYQGWSTTWKDSETGDYVRGPLQRMLTVRWEQEAM